MFRPRRTCQGFLGIFFALSFFPILTFTLFALGTAFTIGGTAFSIVFMTSAFVIGSAGTSYVSFFAWIGTDKRKEN